MISRNCNLSEFVAGVKGLDLRAIRDAVSSEKREAMAICNIGRYVEVLNGIGCLLDTGSRPSGVLPFEFAGMRPIIESLVERGQLKPVALAIFG